MNETLPAELQTIASVREFITLNSDNIFGALPKHLTAERMIRTMCTAMSRNQDLLECTQHSLIGALVEASTLGLEPDGVLGFAYLVPFKNNKAGTTECTMIPGYKGLRELAYRSGKVSKLYMRIVREPDEFGYQYGLKETLFHVPKGNAADNWTHVYAVGKMSDDDDPMFEVMSRADVEAHRDKYAKGTSRRDSAWQTAPEEMAKKTVMRKLLKQMPLSSEIQRHVAADEYYEGGVFDGTPGKSRVRAVDITGSLPAPEPPAEPAQKTTPKKPRKKAEQKPTGDDPAADFEREVPTGTTPDMFAGGEGGTP